MPAGCEFLDMITPQYIADLVSWGAIGARTTESQVHRELASGLSCPGRLQKRHRRQRAASPWTRMRAAQAPHHFLSVTKDGHSAIVSTAGNEDCHIILRGGKQPNYDAANVDAAAKSLAEAGIPARIMIDCSHGNSSKDPDKQVDVGRDVAAQVAAGDARIFGVMVESHLKAGRQDLIPGKALVYGQSITDACIGWEDSRDFDRHARRRGAPTPRQSRGRRRVGVERSRTSKRFHFVRTSGRRVKVAERFSSTVRPPSSHLW